MVAIHTCLIFGLHGLAIVALTCLNGFAAHAMVSGITQMALSSWWIAIAYPFARACIKLYHDMPLDLACWHFSILPLLHSGGGLFLIPHMMSYERLLLFTIVNMAWILFYLIKVE